MHTVDQAENYMAITKSTSVQVEQCIFSASSLALSRIFTLLLAHDSLKAVYTNHSTRKPRTRVQVYCQLQNRRHLLL